jgi:hypothetical protein
MFGATQQDPHQGGSYKKRTTHETGTDKAFKMTRRWRTIKGEHGTWSAKVEWEDGSVERLPCAHEYFCQPMRPGMRYHDPLAWDNGPPQALQDSRMKNWLALVRETNRVILT